MDHWRTAWVALVVLLVTASPAHAAGIRIVDAAPAWTAADRAGPNTRLASREVTFSPNGDGIRDRAVVLGCVPNEVVPMAAVFYRHRRRSIGLVATMRRAPMLVSLGASSQCGRGEQLWRGIWNGDAVLGVDVHRPQGSYWLTLCQVDPAPTSPYSSTCAPQPVLARLQAVWVRLPWTRSIIAGEHIPLMIETDARRVDVEVADADGAPPVIARRDIAPDLVRLRMPSNVRAGLYRVRVRAGTVAVDVPLAVRSIVPLDQPAPHTTLIVAHSLTWLAYDRADADRDGTADSWYAIGPHQPGRGVSLDAPLLTLQPDSAEEDHELWQPFFGWLDSTSRSYQVATDLELARMTPGQLARYGAIWFPGHAEYYTTALYQRLLDYRAGGGDLVFLSANNMYRHVTIDWHTRRIVPAWDTASACACTRDASHSDYAITGSGFTILDLDEHVPMLVADGAIRTAPWLFAGTGLGTGDPVGFGGLELDGPPPADHPAAAEFHPILVGTAHGRPVVTGLSLHASGARTFAAGDEDFIADLVNPAVAPAERAALGRMFDNLWNEFAASP